MPRVFVSALQFRHKPVKKIWARPIYRTGIVFGELPLEGYPRFLHKNFFAAVMT